MHLVARLIADAILLLCSRGAHAANNRATPTPSMSIDDDRSQLALALLKKFHRSGIADSYSRLTLWTPLINPRRGLNPFPPDLVLIPNNWFAICVIHHFPQLHTHAQVHLECSEAPDEIQEYIQARYLSASETAWRIFGFHFKISYGDEVSPCTCNSYPRSRHVEADAQVTLEALCLLHNAPAQLQGRERRNGWFLEPACHCTN